MTTQTYKVLSIDAWGNKDEGYEWNSWHLIGHVTVDIDAPQEQLIDALIEANIFTPLAHDDDSLNVYIKDDEYNLVFCDKETDEPLFAIEYGSVIQ